jgi:hypothetical protein
MSTQEMGGVTGEASAARSPCRAFVVLAIAVFVVILDLFLVNIAFPDIRRSFPSAWPAVRAENSIV